MRFITRLTPLFVLAFILAAAPRAVALERICDVAFENCKDPLINLINNETVGIDVAFWFMEDTSYSTAIINRWKAGVPVRVLMDTEANSAYPGNVTVLNALKTAGIPMREKTSTEGILHWKLMLFVGQNTVEFSGANYSAEAFAPATPYADYVDEVIYFTEKPSLVNSFKSRYDDAWTDTTKFSNYANVNGTPKRIYPTYTQDPEMNWVPWENFATRSIARYRAETTTTYPGTAAIDAIMYRITDASHANEMIAAVGRGVPVRLISEPLQYRDASRLWHSYNIDRMYMAGVQVRHRAHAGLSHEKLTVLKGQKLTIFGSSNWTSQSAMGQHEHNLFTADSTWYTWAEDHFNRKWNNLAPGGVVETEAFVPLPPDAPQPKSPANAATGQSTSVTLKWYAGPWAHKYDVYFGTDPTNLTKIVTDREMGPSQSSTDYKQWTVSNLNLDTIYYWKIVGRTMANLEKSSSVWNFRTTGTGPTAGSNDVVLYAWRATTLPGWSVLSDTTGAGGKRISNANLGAAKISTPLANPTQYFELGFNAAAGVAYRIWIRGKAAGNSYENDSVWVQFSDSVTSSGGAQWQIGTTSATPVTIEDCSNCGLADWGWNDNATGSTAGLLGPLVYFATSGAHTIRVQVREDGLSIDQIILSPDTFLTQAPGSPKSDGTIYPEQGGTTTTTPPPSGTLPTPWVSQDIGAVGIAGSATYNSGVFTLQGSGADIWSSADAFRFAYQTFSGDVTVTARITSMTAAQLWTKGGVMIRSDLTAGSPHASMFLSAGGAGTSFQRRLTAGASTAQTAGSTTAVAPYWVRMTRSGNTFSAYQSSDGTTWTLVGTDTITMPSTVYVGLALTAHDNTQLVTGSFEQVTVATPSAPPPPPPSTLPTGWTFTDIGAVGAAGSASESSGTFTVKGAGADIWGSADAFGYAYTTLTGNGTMVARVASVQNVNSWTKAGVMIRDGLTAGAAHASMFATPSTTKGTAFQRRVVAGGVTTNTSGPLVAPPYWVKVTRSNSTFTASVSPDGVTWTVVGTETITMGSTVNIGLALSSHVAGTLATATFDNVSVTAAP